MKLPTRANQNLKDSTQFGTLAIDFGNTNTIVAFQDETNSQPELLNLSPISRELDEIPSLD